MLLNEFLYFNNENNLTNDPRYTNSRDESVVNKKDTRKIRLTLKQINQLRIQSEAHEKELESELGFIQLMYGTPVEASESQ